MFTSTQDRVGALALVDGYLLTDATHSLPLDLSNGGGSAMERCMDQVQALVARALAAAPVDSKAELAGNVYVAGGGLTSLVEAAAAREGNGCDGGGGDGGSAATDVVAKDRARERVASVLAARVREAVPSAGMLDDVKVILPAEYKYAAWIGASVLASLSLCQVSWHIPGGGDTTTSSGSLGCGGFGGGGAGGSAGGRRGTGGGGRVIAGRKLSVKRHQGLLRRHLFGREDGPNTYWGILSGDWDAKVFCSMPHDMQGRQARPEQLMRTATRQRSRYIEGKSKIFAA